MDRVFIAGKRIFLRPLELSDIEKGYLKWFDNEEICQFNSHHRYPMSLESLTSYVNNVNDDRKVIVLAIITKDGNEHIGNISIQNIDYINSHGEFAIIIGEKSAWGKGYSKEAGRLIIEHVFNQLNLKRIYCGTSEYNFGMQKLAESLGFVKEGVRRKHLYKNGIYNDVFLYGLLVEEWR